MGEKHLRPEPGERALAAPTDEIGEGGTAQNPWEARADLGWRQALWRACLLFLIRPSQGFDATRQRGGYRDPLLFAVCVCVVAALAAELLQGLYELVMDSEGSGDLRDLVAIEIGGERVRGLEWLPLPLLGAASFAGCFVGLLVGIPVFAVMFPLIMLIWTGILHLCLRLVGALRSSAGGYQATWAAVCYSTVGFLPGVVPVIGDWIAFLWLGWLQAIGFWRLHRTTPGRSALALLLPFSIPALLWLLKLVGVFPIEPGADP